ncbi:MAG: hypothetical protein H8E31_15235 [Planctomycetes bacterium]|nr:hypothetical protein [Planctomycetota bacterium]
MTPASTKGQTTFTDQVHAARLVEDRGVYFDLAVAGRPHPGVHSAGADDGVSIEGIREIQS